MAEAPQHTEPRKESLISKINGGTDIRALLSWPDKSELMTSLSTPHFKDKLSVALWEGLKKSITEITKNGISNEQDASIVNTYGVLFLGKNVDSLNSSSGDAEKSAQQTLSEIQEQNMKEYMLQNINSSGLNGEMFHNLVQGVSGLKIDEDGDGVVSKEEKQEYEENLEASVSEESLGGQEKAKRWEILDRIMNYNFDVNHGLRFETNNNGQKTVYESLDQHNPELTKQDFSAKLESITDKYRKELSGENLTNPDKENTKENLKKMITEYFEQNKDSLTKAWIMDIAHLTPQQATKLVSIITMDKLGYNYPQFILPNNEAHLIDKLDPQDKSEYIKWKEWALNCLHEIILLKDQNVKYKNAHWHVFFGELSGAEQNKICNMVGSPGYKWLSWKEMEDFLDKNRNDVTIFYLNFANFYERNQKPDQLPVDELLKWWKWICRNYAVANEKLFDALKDLQDPSDNRLKNSSLVKFGSINSASGDKYEKNDLFAVWEKEANEVFWWGHAWNELVTIDKDQKVHKTQVDPTQADGWDGEKNSMEKADNLYWKVGLLDRTDTRLVQDLTKEWVDSKEVWESLLKLYLSLDKTQLDGDRKKIIWDTIADFVESNKLSVRDTLIYISNTEDMNLNITEFEHLRYELIQKSLENKNYDLALKALWKIPDWSEANLLKIALTMLQSGTDSTGIDMFEKDEILQEKVANMTKSEFKDKFNTFFGIGDYLINHKVIDQKIFKIP